MYEEEWHQEIFEEDEEWHREDLEEDWHPEAPEGPDLRILHLGNQLFRSGNECSPPSSPKRQRAGEAMSKPTCREAAYSSAADDDRSTSSPVSVMHHDGGKLPDEDGPAIPHYRDLYPAAPSFDEAYPAATPFDEAFDEAVAALASALEQEAASRPPNPMGFTSRRRRRRVLLALCVLAALLAAGGLAAYGGGRRNAGLRGQGPSGVTEGEESQGSANSVEGNLSIVGIKTYSEEPMEEGTNAIESGSLTQAYVGGQVNGNDIVVGSEPLIEEVDEGQVNEVEEVPTQVNTSSAGSNIGADNEPLSEGGNGQVVSELEDVATQENTSSEGRNFVDKPPPTEGVDGGVMIEGGQTGQGGEGVDQVAPEETHPAQPVPSNEHPPPIRENCEDDPEFILADNKGHTCLTFVAHAGRATLREARCNHPAGITINGDELLVKNFCAHSCGLCGEAVSPQGAETEGEAGQGSTNAGESDLNIFQVEDEANVIENESPTEEYKMGQVNDEEDMAKQGSEGSDIDVVSGPLGEEADDGKPNKVEEVAIQVNARSSGSNTDGDKEPLSEGVNGGQVSEVEDLATQDNNGVESVDNPPPSKGVNGDMMVEEGQLGAYSQSSAGKFAAALPAPVNVSNGGRNIDPDNRPPNEGVNGGQVSEVENYVTQNNVHSEGSVDNPPSGEGSNDGVMVKDGQIVGDCEDDPAFVLADNKGHTCLTFVAHAGRATLREARCNHPTGIMDDGEELLLKHFCVRSCGMCDGRS